MAAPDQPAIHELLLRHRETWKELSGASVEIVAADSDNADVRIVAAAEMPHWASAGKLAPISLSILDSPSFEAGQFLRHPYRQRLMDWDRKTYAIPILGDSLVLVYRADLLDHPWHKKKLEEHLHHAMRPSGPATWQEWVVIAEYFSHEAKWTDDEKPQPVPRPAWPPLPSSVADVDREFHAVAASFVRPAVNEEKLEKLPHGDRNRVLYNYHFHIETGEPNLEAPGFVAALTFLQQVQKLRPEAPAAVPVRAVFEGTALFALAGLADVYTLQEDPRMKDRIAVGRVPGSQQFYVPADGQERAMNDPDGNAIPYLGSDGWLGTVAANAAHAEAAQNFLAFVGGPQTSLEIVLEPRWGGGPTRMNHLAIDNRSGWFGYGLNKERTNQMLLALESQYKTAIVNPVYRLRVPDERTYRDAFVESIRPALLGKTSPENALRDAAARWKEIGKKDPAARSKEYRLSIGLN
ncbi:MAG TPA: extracellular solute-binding protein [Gemmataceae bacterium]|nr:extracellular solute-binding protein [Gemmataceae bacterium]